MAHSAVYRLVKGVAPNSSAQITLILQDGSRGIFAAKAWDVGTPQVHPGVLVPGVPILLGPLHPPSMIYVEGVFNTAMNPATDRIEVVLGNQTRSIPLSGVAGDSMLAAVFVYP